MKVKRYFAPDTRRALAMVREQQGPDVVILSNRKVAGGVELLTAEDYDESMLMVEQAAVHAAPEQHEPPVVQDPQLLQDPPEPRAAAPTQPGPARREAPAPAAPEPLWTSEPMLEQMRKELKSLRSLVQQQMSGLGLRAAASAHALNAPLLERCVQLGVSDALARELCAGIPDDADLDDAWETALAKLAARLPIGTDDVLEKGGTIALVGPSGVGKTTLVAKLAARYALANGTDSVALISTDNQRVGGQEQLRSFARIVGVPVWTANSEEQLRRTLEMLYDRRLVLIDTAGMCQRDGDLVSNLTMLRGASPWLRSYLVLAASTQSRTLQQTVRAFAQAAPVGCILTKLDEAESLGAALSVAVESALPVAYYSAGQRIPEDLQAASAAELVAEAANRLPAETDDAPEGDRMDHHSPGGILNAAV